MKAFANSIDEEYRIPSYVGDGGANYPDWSQIRLSDIPPITEAGSFDISNVKTNYSTEELISVLGYDPSRSWQAGTRIEDILKLGDFRGVSNLNEWSLSDVAAATGITSDDLKNISLADYGLIKNQTVEDLVFAIPSLAGMNVEDVKPIYDMASLALGGGKASAFGNQTIGDLAASNFDFASLKMDSIDLSQYDLSSIEGIENASFGDFAGSDGAVASEIPYMEYIQMASYIFELANFNFLGKLDVVYGEKEARRINTVSGSYQEGFNVPCDKDSCAHIELTDAMDVGLNLASLHGKQWISGKSQIVEGGFGPLKYANVVPSPGKEPTGRNVFGEFFKVVLTDTDESEGKAEFGLYFRYCMYIFGYRTCTPYFIGPFPWIPHHEKDIIILGLGGTASGGGGSNTGGSGFSNGGSGSNSESGGDEEDETDGALCGQTEGELDYNAMAFAFERIESQGDGKYQAIGVYDCSGGLCGRALGRYQYMTFHSDIQDYILSKPGGEEFLARVNTNNNSASYRRSLAAELPKYFTVEEQNQHFKKDQANNIKTIKGQTDPTTGKTFTGRRLLERLGQVHFGGMNSQIDGGQTDTLGRKTVYQYGREFASHYEQILASGGKKNCQKPNPRKEGDGKTTGKPTHPIPGGAPITSGYGWRIRPISGQRQFHKGIDLGAPIGTAVVTVDGGKVIEVSSNSCPDTGNSANKRNCGGQLGNWIDIRQADGVVVRYGHLQQGSIKVIEGQKVTKGQKIAGVGSSGWSTGPHLDIRVHDGKGNYQDPRAYLGI